MDYIAKYVDFLATENQFKNIIIEYSEGLREKADYIYSLIVRKKGLKNVFINGEARFGSCDIDFQLYDYTKPDLVIHVGHTPFPYYSREILKKKNYKVHYLPVFENIEKYEWVIEILKKEKEKTLLVSSIQYTPVLLKIHNRLMKLGLGEFFYIPKISGLAQGQVIGCLSNYLRRYKHNFSKVYVIGSGYFHAIGVSLYSGIHTYLVDIRKKKLLDMNEFTKRIRSLIAWNLYRAHNKKTFGVLIAKNPIQRKIAHEKSIIHILLEHGKDIKKIYVSRIREDEINMFMDIEVFVTASCPRIAIDDITRFKKPILNLEQLLILFGYKKFGDVYP